MQTVHNIETLLHQSNIEQDYTHSSTIFLNTVKKKNPCHQKLSRKMRPVCGDSCFYISHVRQKQKKQQKTPTEISQCI